MPSLIEYNLKVCLCFTVNVGEMPSNMFMQRQLQSQDQDLLEPKVAADKQGLFPQAQPHVRTTFIPPVGTSEENCTVCCGHTGTCRALSTRFHSNCLKHQSCAVSSRVRLFLQGISGAGTEEEGTIWQMVSKQTNKQTLQKTDGRNPNAMSMARMTWSSLEQQLCWLGN